MNESPAGRDGYILALGRKIYHMYKQDFPMEFWYGLTPDANREDCDGIDVRTLPEKYRKRPVEVRWTAIPRRSVAKAMRDQLRAHSSAFAHALADGYSLEDHMRRERERADAEWAEFQAQRTAREQEQAARLQAGLCFSCGAAPVEIEGECANCAEIPF